MPMIIGTADIRRFADCVRKHYGSSQPASSGQDETRMDADSSAKNDGDFVQPAALAAEYERGRHDGWAAGWDQAHGQPATSAEPVDLLNAIDGLMDFAPSYTGGGAGMVRGGEYIKKSEVVRAIKSCAAPVAQEPVEHGGLLPCPFCGGSAHLSRADETVNVRCDGWNPGECLGAGPNCYTEAEAVAGWNRRAAPVATRSIDMVLYCPACGTQHIDAPDEDWANPPHRSHLCAACGHTWRPADVATNGVAAIKTKGRHDSAPVAAQLRVTDQMVTRFLGWHLPQDFAPGAGISFTPSRDPLCWPVGTDLFNDPQARAMLEYVLQGAPVAVQAQPVPDGWVMVPVEPTKEMAVSGAKELSSWFAPPLHSRDAYRAMLKVAPVFGLVHKPAYESRKNMVAKAEVELASRAAKAQPSAQDQRDAERYRWLRDLNGVDGSGVEIFINDEAHGPGHLTAQIDAARAAKGQA